MKDVLIIVGRSERVEQLIELGVAIEAESDREDDFSSDAIGMAEVIIAPRSRVVGQTLKQINFRQKFGLTVIALWRNGRSYRTDVGDLPLEFGDALLMHGPRDKIRLLQAEPDFIVLQPESGEAQRPTKAWLAAAIMLGTLLVMALGWLPIAEATFTGAVLMIVTKCLTMDEAYQAIEWRAVFLIAGMLPLGLALTTDGRGGVAGASLDSDLWRIRAAGSAVRVLSGGDAADAICVRPGRGGHRGPDRVERGDPDQFQSLCVCDGRGAGLLDRVHDAHRASGESAGDGAGRLYAA